jgi:hypothetical protein
MAVEGLSARLGSVVAFGAELSITVSVDAEGRAWVSLYIGERDGRRGGALAQLSMDGLTALEAKLREARALAERLQAGAPPRPPHDGAKAAELADDDEHPQGVPRPGVLRPLGAALGRMLKGR